MVKKCSTFWGGCNCYNRPVEACRIWSKTSARRITRLPVLVLKILLGCFVGVWIDIFNFCYWGLTCGICGRVMFLFFFFLNIPAIFPLLILLFSCICNLYLFFIFIFSFIFLFSFSYFQFYFFIFRFIFIYFSSNYYFYLGVCM